MTQIDAYLDIRESGTSFHEIMWGHITEKNDLNMAETGYDYSFPREIHDWLVENHHWSAVDVTIMDSFTAKVKLHFENPVVAVAFRLRWL